MKLESFYRSEVIVFLWLSAY